LDGDEKRLGVAFVFGGPNVVAVQYFLCGIEANIIDLCVSKDAMALIARGVKDCSSAWASTCKCFATAG
jgi:hypothetical protein